MDVYPGKPGDEEFFNTIAHESQHLINYSIRLRDGKTAAVPQETWIDEGLSSAAEYLYSGEHIKEKIDYFNEDKLNTFSRGTSFLNWENEYEDYCTIYLFFQWLRIHGNTEIYKDIINSNFLDYRAVVEAAAKHIDPKFSDWETLLGHWLLANHVNAPTGSLGYEGKIKTQIRSITGLTTISLAPGAGVFSYLDGKGFTPAQSGTNIRYLGVTGGELITREGLSSSMAKGRVLTFNANTQASDAPETGSLTGKTEPVPRDIGVPQETGQRPHPIDIPPAFLLERN
jgi:hypothetical protein